MDYFFECHQYLKFIVEDYDSESHSDFLGEHEVELGIIMISKGNTYEG